MSKGPIGIFDSGYGGLTVLKEITAKLPQYDYVYLGDNARAPYGSKSFDTVYHYTLQCVEWFFSQGCSLVILACNTASAKALRTIQQNDLVNKALDGGKKSIRCNKAHIRNYWQFFSKTKNVGILGNHRHCAIWQSYLIEIEKFFSWCKGLSGSLPHVGTA